MRWRSVSCCPFSNVRMPGSGKISSALPSRRNPPMRKLLAALLFAPALASAQKYPTKPIEVVVPFGPGGVADITVRVVAPKISEDLGQQLVIENKPSAGGVVAGQEAARARPDGYKLLLINNGTAISRALFRSLPYEPEKDFAMISTVGFFPLVIVADPKSPLKTVQG